MQVLTPSTTPPGGGQTPIAHQMALEAPAAREDFWDVADQNFAGKQGGPDPEFSELVAVQGGESKGRVAMYGLLVLILAVVGYGAFEFFVNDTNPIDELIAAVQNLLGSDETEVDQTPPAPRPKPHKPAPVVKAKPAGTLLKVVKDNPYWSLPNKRLGADADLGKMWSPEEEETLRAGLTHKYTYQRWKTVQDVRKSRHAGSDVILWDALQDKKLWTRMWAIMGLAEVNVDIQLKDVERGLGKARSELVADYFERFVRKPNPAQLYIMRQAVRVLDERGRLVVLRAIHRSKDALRDVYMAAATLDPGRHVQEWVKQALWERPIQPDRFNDLRAMIRGQAGADDLIAAMNGKTVTKKKVKSKGGDRVRTGEDLDTNGEDVGDGDVEFYDHMDEDGTKKTDDRPDPKTFEYSE